MDPILPEGAPERFYNEIRDRIAEILLVEIPAQGVLLSDDRLTSIDKIYVERSVPFSKENLPALNVMFDKVDSEQLTQISKEFSAVYFVDVYGSIAETDDQRADEASAKFVQFLSGLVDAIIGYGGYARLGFPIPTAENPNGIAHREIFDIQQFNPEKTKDASTMMRSRVKIRVIGSLTEQTVAPVLLAGSDTFLSIDENDNGYYITSSPGGSPPAPQCPPAEIRDTAANVIGSAPSGGFGIVSDTRVSNSDDSFDVNVLAQSPLELPDVAHTDSDGSPVVYPSAKPFVCTPVALSGTQYHEPNNAAHIGTNYANHDAKWRYDNGVFRQVTLPTPAFYQQLDMDSADPYNTLIHNNVYGNKFRFTAPDGAATAPSSSNDMSGDDGFIDHLTGRHYFVWAGGSGFRNWAIALSVNQASGWYCLSSQEWFSLVVSPTTRISILGFDLPITGSQFPWTCDTDAADPLKGNRTDDYGLTRLSLAKTSSSRTPLYVKIWGGI